MKRSSAMPKRNRENKKAKSKGHGIVFTRALLVFRTRLARGIPLDARLCERHSARCAVRARHSARCAALARHFARCAALRAAFRSMRGFARGIPLDARFSRAAFRSMRGFARGIPLGARLARGIPLGARLCAPSVFRTYPRTKNTSAAGASRGKSGRGRTRFPRRTARGSLPFRSERDRAPRLSDLRSLCRP